MITLYAFGPFYGLPDLSPFVMKAEMLLKIAGLDYVTNTTGFNNAPKGKLPYIDDDGDIIADTTFIRRHIEKKYGVDFDKGLDAEQRAIAWAFERMFEDHIYWTLMHARWVDEDNFNRGPRVFFQRLPIPMRLIVPRLARRQMSAQVMGQGMGRHSAAEIAELGTRSFDAAAAFLGQKTYSMGDALSGLDATAFAFLASALCPVFETPLRTAVERHDNIKTYVRRMTDRYYPDYPEMRQWAA